MIKTLTIIIQFYLQFNPQIVPNAAILTPPAAVPSVSSDAVTLPAISDTSSVESTISGEHNIVVFMYNVCSMNTKA